MDEAIQVRWSDAMATIRVTFKHAAAGSMLVAAALLAGSANALAQPVDLEQQILKSLLPTVKPTTPRPPTRSLTATPADTSRTVDRKLLDSVKNRPTRSLTTDEREQIAEIAKDRPSVDIEINFDYRSAKIGPAAIPSVTALGKALTNPELKGSTFILAGHTDAKGSLPANQDLSEKRADSIKNYLVDRFKIPASTLVTVGYGKTKLKNETEPFAPENRRVQVVNTEEKSVSQQ
jgi:outer membrane protein OmpA-like peptidoglycan-associated protein